MIHDLPLEILIKIICYIPNPRTLLQSCKLLHKSGRDLSLRATWVVHQSCKFRSWLSISAQNGILTKELIMAIIRILDDLPSQGANRAKLIDWIGSHSRPKRFHSVTQRLKHAIVSKNERLLMEFMPFFATENGKKMKNSSVELCQRVGFRKGVWMLKSL